MLWYTHEHAAKLFLYLVTHVYRLCLNIGCSFTYNTWKNKTQKCDTEGFVPVASMCGVVGLPSSFIISLIGTTGEIWYVVYINVKWTYTSGTLACTIRECETVRNVLLSTSTCIFIYWCSGAANVKTNPLVWHSSLNSFEVNWVPASAEIISKSHHPNWSIFPHFDRNISNLSISSSVVIFSIP